MLRGAMYVTVNIIFIHFDIHSFDISYVVTLDWPPKGLRNRLVARGRKRLCTTDLHLQLRQFLLFSFKSRLFSTCLLCMITYKNVLRPVHDHPATSHDPKPKIWGFMTPPTIRIDAYARRFLSHWMLTR